MDERKPAVGTATRPAALPQAEACWLRSHSTSMKCVALCVCLTSAELAACAYLPTAGPTAGEVIDQGLQDNRIRYAVVDINRGVVDALLAQPTESFRTRFGKYSRPTPPRIGIGDTISITIWEAAGGGLFGTSPIGGVSPGSRSVAIPEQVVGADGGVSVPFAGRIPVAGRSTVDVQRGIEQRLAEKAIEPQVIVTITKSVTYAATVSGEVVNGARVPLSVNGDRLLDLIALAGGGKICRLRHLRAPFARRGDRDNSDGEAGLGSRREHICTAGRCSDSGTRAPNLFSAWRHRAERADHLQRRADHSGRGDCQGWRIAGPAFGSYGVFLFRFEPPAVVTALNAPQLGTGPDRSSPVVYRLDMSDANAYFLAQRFTVEDKDVIYVANARLNELQKFFTLLNTLTGPVITGIVVKNAAP